MASIRASLQKIMNIDGAIGAVIVDHESAVTLGTIGGEDLDMELAGAGNTRFILMALEVLDENGRGETPEDVLVTLDRQYHLTRFSAEHDTIFTYLILDREEANLALARRQLAQVEDALDLDEIQHENPLQ
jgi:predicted regulator of Ras-like GTPase activity (Roadblock/LC7/MglB family)